MELRGIKCYQDNEYEEAPEINVLCDSENDTELGIIPSSPVAVVSFINAHNLLTYCFQFHSAIHHSSRLPHPA